MSNLTFLYTDPQAKAMNLMTTVEHPSLGGTYWRHAPLINFSETPARAQAVCENGEHTRAILGELGYNDADVDELRSANVVGCPSDQ
jgi:crotonobetainyl-CoA:carnitine CoA-transferase CaiB-like acyl-CoA transferase